MKPRYMTQSEINNILKDIVFPFPVTDITSVAIDRKKKFIQNELEKNKVYPHLISEVKKKIIINFYKSIAPTGTPVGVLAAQSIGEPATQSALNTFHLAGVGNPYTSGGLERMVQIFAASQDQKKWSCSIYLDPSINTDKPETVLKYMREKMIPITSSDICKEIVVYNYEKHQWWYYKEVKDMDCYIRFKFNVELLYYHNISLKYIAEIFRSNIKDIIVMYSPITIAEIHIFVKNISHIDIDNEFLKQEDISDDEILFYSLRDGLTPRMSKLLISGVESIVDIDVARCEETNKWMMYSLNGNINTLLFDLPFINSCRTISTNIWNIYNTLGIEATRELIRREISSVVKSSGSRIAGEHINLVADSMTYTGIPLSLSRYSMGARRVHPLASASFEQVIESFINAAISNKRDPLVSVSASVAMGQPIQVGTGKVTIKMDPSYCIQPENNDDINLSEYIYNSSEFDDEDGEFNGVFDEEGDESDSEFNGVFDDESEEEKDVESYVSEEDESQVVWVS